MEFQVIFLYSLFFINRDKFLEEKRSSLKKKTLALLTFFFLYIAEIN